MTHVNEKQAPLWSRLNWTNTLFLIISPLLVILFVPLHIHFYGLDWRLLLLLVVMYFLTGLSITAGYHRLFAHRSYQAGPLVKLFYLIFGSAALQGSVIKWASDHRRHHRSVDTEEDPYQIQKGFFYAHMGWVFFKDDPKYREEKAKDLVSDPLIAWQDKYNFAISLYIGFLVPALIGLALGSPWGGLLYGCLFRVVLSHHGTFFINSLCHMWGSQPYNDKNSAKDNFLLAFFTYGEGYHNFHHKFEADYRNGIRWYHWDPTKWLIKSLSYVGLTTRLRRVPDHEILKARLAVDEKKLVTFGRYDEKLNELRQRIEDSQKKIILFKKSYDELKKDLSEHGREKLEQARRDIELAKIEFKAALKQWRVVCET